jgi:hypothetical protein
MLVSIRPIADVAASMGDNSGCAVSTAGASSALSSIHPTVAIVARTNNNSSSVTTIMGTATSVRAGGDTIYAVSS